ncbi:MAG: transglutaminase-like cysteine peptidase, partial [Kiloniellaceae bacterium]
MFGRSGTIALVAILTLVVGLSSAGPAKGQTLADAIPPMPPFSHAILGSAEFELAGLAMLPQWRRVVSRMKIESEALARCSVDETRCASPAMRSWRQIGAAAAGLDRMEKLRAVNRFFNRWPYKTDRMVYGVGEYWATPTEFMSRSGDCEDYAIAKFFALRELGF